MNIEKFRYNHISDTDRRLLENLLGSVWKEMDLREVHPREMDAMSFCVVDGDRFIGYAGVITRDIRVRGEMFKLCGLSCVCTHPRYRRAGIGTILVRKATEWMLQENRFDLGLFTCSHEHTPFYENTGLWERSPDLVLKESGREGAYSSDRLHLNVFKLLISPKAELYAGYFRNTVIDLHFPEGKFI